jgi:anti-sigma regulatory factor (Ser/Thr protein kinase)
MSAGTSREVIRYRMGVDDRSARRARHLAVAALNAWALAWLVDAVASCAAELVGNVFTHAAAYGPDCELAVSLVPGQRLAIEVRDRDPRLPERRKLPEVDALSALASTEPDDWLVAQLAESGRGLALVDALCDRLTWHPLPEGGKVVRCCWLLTEDGGGPTG